MRNEEYHFDPHSLNYMRRQQQCYTLATPNALLSMGRSRVHVSGVVPNYAFEVTI